MGKWFTAARVLGVANGASKTMGLVKFAPKFTDLAFSFF